MQTNICDVIKMNINSKQDAQKELTSILQGTPFPEKKQVVEYCNDMMAIARCAHQYELPSIESAAYGNMEKVVNLEMALPVLRDLSLRATEHDMQLCNKLREHCWKAIRNLDSDEFVCKMDAWIFLQLCTKNLYE